MMKADSRKKNKGISFSVCGNKVYKLMQSILSPSKLGDKTYEELVSLVKSYYNPKLK